jgi:hypothetical protein
MSRRWCEFARRLRSDDGMTSVENAVVVALLIGAVVVSVSQFGERVQEPATKANIGTSGPQMAKAVRAPEPPVTNFVNSPPASASDSYLTWALLSLVVTVGSVGMVVGGYRLLDLVRETRTRRQVHRCVADRKVQATLDRMVAMADAEPIMRFNRAGANLIGRGGPDLHHWIKGPDVMESAELDGVMPCIEASDAAADVRAGRIHPIPTPPPAVPAAG